MDVARFILGIDAGGTAVKAGVYGLDGEELGLASRVLRPVTSKQSVSPATETGSIYSTRAGSRLPTVFYPPT